MTINIEMIKAQIQETPTEKLKHVEARRVWAFVHGKGDLERDELLHLPDCKHCEAVLTFFALYGADEPEVGDIFPGPNMND